MRHQQRSRAGIEERARETRQRFGAGLVTGNGVARREHHPVRVELELRDVILIAARLSPPSFDGSNRGSPNPVIGLTPGSRRANARSAFRLVTDGSTETA